MSLTEEEKLAVNALMNVVGNLPENVRETGADLAEHLRAQLPDVDDVTLGRVMIRMGNLLAAAGMAPQVGRTGPSPEVMFLAAGWGYAGIDLLAEELL